MTRRLARWGLAIYIAQALCGVVAGTYIGLTGGPELIAELQAGMQQ